VTGWIQGTDTISVLHRRRSEACSFGGPKRIFAGQSALALGFCTPGYPYTPVGWPNPLERHSERYRAANINEAVEGALT